RSAGGAVESGVVQRALDHVAGEVAGRERGARMTADVAEGVEVAADVHDERALAADHDALHRARRQLGGGGDRNEAFEHAAGARATGLVQLEAEHPRGVLRGDFSEIALGDAGEDALQEVAGLRPGRYGVREVAPPEHVVDADRKSTRLNS